MDSVTTTPRTVEQLRALDRELTKCDYLLDRAVTRGNLEASIRHEERLNALNNLMVSVSDALWGRYCEQELLAQEEV